MKKLLLLLLIAGSQALAAVKARPARAATKSPSGALKNDAASKEMSIEKSPVGKDGESNPQVLNFDSDLIEGERKRPDLFLQVGTQRLSLDAILFRRNDFNDFHQVDKARRPGYLLIKPRKKQ